MAKIILNDGSEEYVSPAEARARVAAGEAKFEEFVPTYSTRQITADKPKKTKRKRRTKAEIEAAAAECAAETEAPADESA